MSADRPEFSAPALCAERDPEIWFPRKGGTTLPAKRICNGDGGRPPCPAREECLAWALAHNEAGVWGGKSERERKRLRARPAAPPPECGTTAGYKLHLKRQEPPCPECWQANSDYCREYRRRQQRRGAA